MENNVLNDILQNPFSDSASGLGKFIMYFVLNFLWMQKRKKKDIKSLPIEMSKHFFISINLEILAMEKLEEEKLQIYFG